MARQQAVKSKFRPDLLLDLANFLDGLPSQVFDMDGWVDDTADENPLKRKALKAIEKKCALDKRAAHTCGTTGCAMGWAPSVPSLRKAGLRLKVVTYGNIKANVKPEDDVYNDIGFEAYPVLERRGKETIDDPFEAAAELFGIHEDVSDHLFSPESYDSSDDPKEVAARIRELVADPTGFYKDRIASCEG